MGDIRRFDRTAHAVHRHCEERSDEAIYLTAKKNGLPRRCAPRNDGCNIRDSRFNLQRADRVCIRVPAARSARVMHDLAPKITEGAGNAGCATHPRPVCIGRKHTVVTTGRPQSTGIPCAMVLRLISRSPRGPGCFAPVIPEKLASQELSASVGAPGPHDFAVRLSYARLASLRRPPHPAPNVRDDAYAPLFGAGRLRTYN